MAEMNLNQWLEVFEENKNAVDIDTAVKLGFYDWFCVASALMNKIRKMAPMVKRIIKSGLVDNEKAYVFFKNNCPMKGGLYDSFSIADIETGDVLYWCNPNHNKDRKARLIKVNYDSEHETLFEGTTKELAAYLDGMK